MGAMDPTCLCRGWPVGWMGAEGSEREAKEVCEVFVQGKCLPAGHRPWGEAGGCLCCPPLPHLAPIPTHVFVGWACCVLEGTRWGGGAASDVVPLSLISTVTLTGSLSVV